jgi:D-galactonate transporter
VHTPAITSGQEHRLHDTEHVYAKVTWRLVPLLFICYVISYLDRINVGFAQLQMKSELGFSDTVYGFGAGIFFVGYFLFEVPSNLLLEKIGARLTLFRIMFVWGLLSAAMAFASGPMLFYVIRFLLGVFEAGFFPGVILYLTYWYPGSRRARIIAMFMSGIAIAGVLGGPISGWIMNDMAGVAGLSGWQWMFILEGLPATLLGIIVFFYLDDRPEDAKWLSRDEQAVLRHHLDLERTDDPMPHHGQSKRHSAWEAFRDPRVYVLSFCYFCFICGVYVISFWLPTFIKEMGVQNPLQVGLLSVIPYGITAVGMVLIGRHSDLKLERRWHCAIPAFLGAVGLVAMVHTPASNIPLALVFLTLASLGIITTMPIFWAIPTAYLRDSAAAGGIAFINSLGLTGGFLSPFLLGWIKTTTGSLSLGLYVMAGIMIAGGLTLLLAVPANLLHEHSEAE